MVWSCIWTGQEEGPQTKTAQTVVSLSSGPNSCSKQDAKNSWQIPVHYRGSDFFGLSKNREKEKPHNVTVALYQLASGRTKHIIKNVSSSCAEGERRQSEVMNEASTETINQSLTGKIQFANKFQGFFFLCLVGNLFWHNRNITSSRTEKLTPCTDS